MTKKIICCIIIAACIAYIVKTDFVGILICALPLGFAVDGLAEDRWSVEPKDTDEHGDNI